MKRGSLRHRRQCSRITKHLWGNPIYVERQKKSKAGAARKTREFWAQKASTLMKRERARKISKALKRFWAKELWLRGEGSQGNFLLQ